MATLMQRLQTFLRSPKGQKLVQQGRQQLAKPENQARIRQIMTKARKR
ncbi:hypothetical protein GCM10010435_38510 [Winogradskya consettensis]|uniref:Uncharacterized protein n=2 Tax=Winogradskya TaxID=3240235 RepID=A0A919W1R8_9ACTN|nr:hypothetical protein [Actinoplanes humidus]GIE17568.1 hypothetical protein Ahu01nite_006700 [Actinoplanes humidus]GIM84071.1 hypothetical protein Aco04nite_89610 [Actinoplanes consettensis]